MAEELEKMEDPVQEQQTEEQQQQETVPDQQTILKQLVLQQQQQIAQLQDQLLSLKNSNSDVGKKVSYEELDEMFLAKPTETMANILKKFKEQLTDELYSRLKRDNDYSSFWENFFSKNPDLRGFNDVFQQVLTEDSSIIGSMNREELEKHISKRARKVLKDRFEAFKSLNSNSKPTVTETGGMLTWPSSGVTDEKEAGESLSEIIAENRKRKLKR